EIKHGITQSESEARQVATFFESESHSNSPSLIGLIDLVKHAAVREMRLLGLLPAPENFINGDQLYLRKSRHILLGIRFKTWPVIIFRRDLLTLGRIEVFEVGLSYGAGALLIHNLVHD